MNIDDAVDEWNAAQSSDRCCSCHLHPPCSFCMEGFSLDLEEYIEIYHGGFEEEVENKDDAYDRAMDMLK